jgi:hypothetical protein
VPLHGLKPTALDPLPVEHLGDPQVNQLDQRAARRAPDLHDVPGLHVAVDHAHVVQGREGPRRLRDQLDDLAPGQRALLAQPFVEALAGEQLEYHERRPGVGLADREHLDEVWVPKVGQDAALLDEPAPGVLPARLEDLDGRHAAQRLVPTGVHPRGPPRPEQLADLEAVAEHRPAPVGALL